MSSRVYNFDSIIALIKGAYNGRKLLIWGAWEIGWELAEALRENHLELYAYVDSNHYDQDYKGYPVINSGDLQADNRSEYYLIVSLVEHASVYKALEEKQWKEFEDFIYLGKTVTLTSCKNHLDVYGNRIESKIFEDLEIKMACSSRLIIEEGVRIGKNVRIEATMLSEIWIQKGVSISDNSYIRANCKGKIIIGPQCHFGNNLCMNVHSNGKFVLDSKCYFDRDAFMEISTDGIATIGKACEFAGDAVIRVGYGGKIRIGSHSTFSNDTIIRVFHATEFECGSDCMFSYCTRIRGEDGHAIIDMKNRKIMERKKNVKLGNHVWVAMGATIFPGTEMGDHSIVGANSLVNRPFPSNCIVIGTPARIHKTNVSWDRDAEITYEEWEKGKENV